MMNTLPLSPKSDGKQNTHKVIQVINTSNHIWETVQRSFKLRGRI